MTVEIAPQRDTSLLGLVLLVVTLSATATATWSKAANQQQGRERTMIVVNHCTCEADHPPHVFHRPWEERNIQSIARTSEPLHLSIPGSGHYLDPEAAGIAVPPLLAIAVVPQMPRRDPGKPCKKHFDTAEVEEIRRFILQHKAPIKYDSIRDGLSAMISNHGARSVYRRVHKEKSLMGKSDELQK